MGACDLCSRHVITGKCVVSYKLCVDISSSVVPSSEERERIITVHRPRAAHQQEGGGGGGSTEAAATNCSKSIIYFPNHSQGSYLLSILFPAFLLM